MPNRYTNGTQLRGLRARRGLSQTDAAAKAQISSGYLREIEKGRAQPRPEVIYRLADALDASIDDFTAEAPADQLATA